jgi:hypothetical protein
MCNLLLLLLTWQWPELASGLNAGGQVVRSQPVLVVLQTAATGTQQSQREVATVLWPYYCSSMLLGHRGFACIAGRTG